jgi:hypothetical protein
VIYDIAPYLAKATGMRPGAVEVALEAAEAKAAREYPERNIQTFSRMLELFREKHPFDLTALQRARDDKTGASSGNT